MQVLMSALLEWVAPHKLGVWYKNRRLARKHIGTGAGVSAVAVAAGAAAPAGTEAAHKRHFLAFERASALPATASLFVALALFAALTVAIVALETYASPKVDTSLKVTLSFKAQYILRLYHGALFLLFA